MIKPVYANPLMPDVCPILSLAILVLCQNHDKESLFVFGSSVTNANTKFEKWFHDILGSVCNDPEMQNDLLGLHAEYFGTHSFRKGSGTNASCSALAPIINLFLRAGWTIGQVSIIMLYLLHIYLMTRIRCRF